MAAALFLDRDGVINRNPGDQYITRWEQFEFLPGALDAIRDLSGSGWPLVVVSNQAGVTKGLMSREDLDDITCRMRQGIETHGGRLTDVLYCTHVEADGCQCRKPKPGLLLQAAQRFHFRLSDSLLIGDDPRDVQAARAAGCRAVAVLSGRNDPEQIIRWPQAPERIFKDLREAADWILAGGLASGLADGFKS